MNVFNGFDNRMPQSRKEESKGPGKKASLGRGFIKRDKPIASSSDIRSRAHELAKTQKGSNVNLSQLVQKKKAAEKKLKEQLAPPTPEASLKIAEEISTEKIGTEKIQVVAAEDSEAMGDVGINNPKDPAVKGKLKDLLSSGGFSFNDKERDVLNKILQKES